MGYSDIDRTAELLACRFGSCRPAGLTSDQLLTFQSFVSD
jgi:hypothetical protein